MKLYDWILKNGMHVDYWHTALAVGGWFPNASAEDHALNGLGIGYPPKIEAKLNGVVLPFEVLLQLLGIDVPDDIAKLDFGDLIRDIRDGKYYNLRSEEKP